jgi:heme exporter protein C
MSELKEGTAQASPVSAVRKPNLKLWTGLTIASFAVLLPMALLWAPEDEAQGAAQRIFYIHVPSAWIGFLAFGVVFVASIAVLSTSKRKWDDLAAASAEVGVIFTLAVVLSGPIWGKSSWGIWWTWDPKLTAVFILLCMYLSYLALRSYVTEPLRRARFSAVLGIVAFLDIPIIVMAVQWWRGQHPESVMTGDGMESEMAITLMVGNVAFTFLFLLLLKTRMYINALKRARIEEMSE